MFAFWITGIRSESEIPSCSSSWKDNYWRGCCPNPISLRNRFFGFQGIPRSLEMVFHCSLLPWLFRGNRTIHSLEGFQCLSHLSWNGLWETAWLYRVVSIPFSGTASWETYPWVQCHDRLCRLLWHRKKYIPGYGDDEEGLIRGEYIIPISEREGLKIGSWTFSSWRLET